MTGVQYRRLKTALDRHKADLMGKGAHIVYIGYKVKNGKKTDRLAVICGVAKKIDKSQVTANNLIPQMVDNCETDVMEIEPIVAQSRTSRNRPAPGGVSIGHYAITAGTLGCLVRHPNSLELFILSNNHVLANSNNANVGDDIYQPGVYDGGNANDKIGELHDWVPIDFGGGNGGGGGCPIGSFVTRALNKIAEVFGRKTRVQVTPQAVNNVDAAIAKPTTDNLVTKNIMEIGVPTGHGVASLGDPVKKSGRTTGLTTGFVEGVGATVSISYGSAGTAVFTDQLVLGPMSAGGDSGSVILNNDNQVVALLFAGSSSTTIVSPIHYALDAFGVGIET
jgi:hypothetical protein